MPHPLRLRLSISAAARLVGYSQANMSRLAASGELGPIEIISNTLSLVSLPEIEKRFGQFTALEIDTAIMGRRADWCSRKPVRERVSP
jgi:hypothetical protein